MLLVHVFHAAPTSLVYPVVNGVDYYNFKLLTTYVVGDAVSGATQPAVTPAASTNGVYAEYSVNLVYSVAQESADSFPAGLYVDNTTGQIYGTPTGPCQEATAYTIQVINSGGVTTTVVNIAIFQGWVTLWICYFDLMHL